MKIGIYISSRLLFRSWVSTGVYDELNQNAELTLYVTQKVYEANVDFCKSNCAIVIPNCAKENLYRYLHQAYLVRFRDKCITFKYVLERKLLGNSYWHPNNLSGAELFKHKFNMFRDSVYTVRKSIFLYANYISSIGEASIWLLRKRLQSVNIIPSNLIEIDFDYFIIPSSADDPYLYGLIAQLRRLQIKSVLAIDNWDNLTSKSVFPFNPDFLTVMGEPCRQHANAIHGIDTDQIWVLGLPKFEVFRQKKSPNKRVQNSVFTVLYLGFSLQHNEIRVLNKIYKALLSKHGENNFRVIYRPHPYALERVRADETLNKNIEVEVVSIKDLNLNGAPSYNDAYFHSLQLANLVIGPPTTMLIEAMLMDKSCLVDSTDDGQHRTTSKICHEKFLHIQDLYLIPELEFIHDLSDVDKFTEVSMADTKKYSVEKIVNNSKSTYVQQLMEEFKNQQSLKS